MGNSESDFAKRPKSLQYEPDTSSGEESPDEESNPVITKVRQDHSPDQTKNKSSLRKRSQKTIGRSLPVFVDLIIFILQVGLLGTFFYYSYIYPDLSTIPCVANAYSSKPLSADTNTKGVDVTAKFR
jgi:hypothetical protein